MQGWQGAFQARADCSTGEPTVQLLVSLDTSKPDHHSKHSEGCPDVLAANALRGLHHWLACSISFGNAVEGPLSSLKLAKICFKSNMLVPVMSSIPA